MQIAEDENNLVWAESEHGSVYQDEWIHLAGTFKQNESIKIYINGQLAGENTDNIPAGQYNNSLDIMIGMRPDNICPFEGTIDDVRVYDKALNQEKVIELYNEYANY